MAASEVSIDVHDHGIALDEQKKRVKCNFCEKVVSGFSRLKCHLAGVRGDVAPCMKVPSNVKETLRKVLLEKKRGNLCKEVEELYYPNLPLRRNWCPRTDTSKAVPTKTSRSGSKKRVREGSLSEKDMTESISFPNWRLNSKASASGIEDSSLREAHKCIGRFFYETGIDFSAATSPNFQKMINSTLGSGQLRYRIPTCEELKGWILLDAVKEMRQYVNEIKSSWPSTGCSILLDGWVDSEGRNLINILADCPSGTVFLRSSNISALDGDIDAMLAFFDEILEEVGVKNVVQIITYSISACMEEVGKRLMDKHRTLFWTVSASHCLELMLNKFVTMDSFKDILEKAKTITRFIYSHAAILKLLRDHTFLNDLIEPSKIKSIAPFLTLEKMVFEKERVRRFFSSSNWKSSIWASTREGKCIAGLVADQSFWMGAKMVLNAAIPLVRVIELINKENKPQVGYIYETIDQAKETIKEEFKHKKSQYMPFWKIIDEIWNTHLHSPLHSAGYFLNPCLFYARDFYSDTEVATGLCCCVVRMAENCTVQDLITLQVDDYRMGKGAFGAGSASSDLLDIAPATWWLEYGGQCPELQRLAVRILSQTCSGASKYDLKRHLAEMLHTEGRNRIEQQRLSDLVFVHYNLHLQNFSPSISNETSLDEIDPMDDWVADKTRQSSLPDNSEMTWMDLDFEGAIATHGHSSFHPNEEA